MPRSATASIDIGVDSYFDNETILTQFERLFQLLEYKEAFQGFAVEVVVDNSRTHTAKSHSVHDFSKSIGTQCKVDTIEYVENGQSKMLHCRFQNGPNQGKTKGLLEIAKELRVKLPAKINLDELRSVMSEHSAFKTVSICSCQESFIQCKCVFLQVSRLELLAQKYKVIIKWCPKFHCELNVIEGLWCSQKQFVRRRTDQTYKTMLKLIIDSREYFKERDIFLKLMRRFWRCLQSYEDGQDYATVMKQFFSEKCAGTVKTHTRISNSRLT